MFNNLLNLSYRRNRKEAVGLYIAYLIIIMLGSMVFSGLLGLATGNENSFEFGLRIGNIIAIITSLSLSFLILKSKNLMGNFFYILLSLLSGLLAYFGGGILGLIPVSFLSTRQENKG